MQRVRPCYIFAKETRHVTKPALNLGETIMFYERYAHPLKLASIVIGAAGFFIANELQRRETEEIVKKELDRRETMKSDQNA